MSSHIEVGKEEEEGHREPAASHLYSSSALKPPPEASEANDEDPDPGVSTMVAADATDEAGKMNFADASAEFAPKSPTLTASVADKNDLKKIPPISPIVKLAASSSKIRAPKIKYPPPFPELIYGYHHNDVLCGRGATINAHPGNRRYRTLCADRKSEFESSTNFQKREIAREIVESVLEWGGRFIERVDDRHGSSDEVEAFFRQVDVDKVLVGSSAAYFYQMGYTHKKNRKLKRELGPWRDMGIERAITKTLGVIRDHKRPDRIALRAMGLLKRNVRSYPQNHNDGHISPPITFGRTDEVPTQEINVDTTAEDDDVSAVYKDLVPTPNDVLLGRGAFINEHIGNRHFRNLALERKALFDAANPVERRAIAIQIIGLTKALIPPGRFLKRAPYALRQPVLLSDGKYQLPPRGLEGPWEEISDAKACAKAIQVMRDLKPKATRSEEMMFEEAEQVAALASVNASMKDSMGGELEQSVAIGNANTPFDSAHDYSELPDQHPSPVADV